MGLASNIVRHPTQTVSSGHTWRMAIRRFLATTRENAKLLSSGFCAGGSASSQGRQRRRGLLSTVAGRNFESAAWKELWDFGVYDGHGGRAEVDHVEERCRSGAFLRRYHAVSPGKRFAGTPPRHRAKRAACGRRCPDRLGGRVTRRMLDTFGAVGILKVSLWRFRRFVTTVCALMSRRSVASRPL